MTTLPALLPIPIPRGGAGDTARRLPMTRTAESESGEVAMLPEWIGDG